MFSESKVYCTLILNTTNLNYDFRDHKWTEHVTPKPRPSNPSVPPSSSSTTQLGIPAKSTSELHAEAILLDLQKRGISASVSLLKTNPSNPTSSSADTRYKPGDRGEQRSSEGKGKVVKCAICYETISGPITDHLKVHKVSSE